MKFFAISKFCFSRQHTRLTIFFGDDEFALQREVERYTWTDFLGICGGLFGLFIGVSYLSVFELIYYWTIRLFWVIYWSKYERNEEPPDQTEVGEMHVNRNDVINRNPMVRFSYDEVGFVCIHNNKCIHNLNLGTEAFLFYLGFTSISAGIL